MITFVPVTAKTTVKIFSLRIGSLGLRASLWLCRFKEQQILLLIEDGSVDFSTHD